MSELVVRTVQELKALEWSRSHPTIFIDKELANNLLVSGLLTVADTNAPRRGLVTTPEQPDRTGPMREVLRILNALRIYNHFELEEGRQGIRIRIFPKTANRREGN
jgi:hypothetical protein